MTTPTPTGQPCPACRALVYYEGHSELRGTLVPHRFHCHACGRAYVVRSTSHKPPRFPLSARHEVREAVAHEHPPAEEAAAIVATPPAEPVAAAAPSAPTPATEPLEEAESTPTEEAPPRRRRRRAAPAASQTPETTEAGEEQ